MYIQGIKQYLFLVLVCLSNISIAHPLIQTVGNIVKYGVPCWLIGRDVEGRHENISAAQQYLAYVEKRLNIDEGSYLSAFDPHSPIPDNVFMVCNKVSERANIGKGVLFMPSPSTSSFGTIERIVLLAPTSIIRMQEATRTANYDELVRCSFYLHHEMEHIRHNDVSHINIAIPTFYAAAEVGAHYVERAILGRQSSLPRQPLMVAGISIGLLSGKLAATFIGYCGYRRYEEKRADYKALQYFKDPYDVEQIIQEYKSLSNEHCFYEKERLRAYGTNNIYLKKFDIYLNKYPQLFSLWCSVTRCIYDPTHPSFSSRAKQAERYKAQLLAQQSKV